MMRRDRDDALSELIGFVLLLGILTVALSLYITYAVPAQGRENEIAHMNYIGQQMVGVKGDIDSLWINNRQNVPIYRSINLGTQSGLTQGGLSGLPLLNPVGSGGTLGINEKKDNIQIGIERTDASSSLESDIILYPGMPVWLNVVYTPETIITITDLKGTTSATIFETANNITISAQKNGNFTISNATIIANPVSTNIYPINILDGAYGMSSGLNYPTKFKITSGQGASFVIPQSYTLSGAEITFPIKHVMGSVDYRSKNNYWVYQNYYYQNGGVFLKQDEGMAIMASPEISVQRFQEDPPYTLVTVTDLVVQPPQGTTQLGGTTSVQLVESVSAPRHTVITNLQKVIITVSDSDDAKTAEMWRSIFTKIYPSNPPSADPAADPALTVSEYPTILDYTQVPVNVNLQINRAI